MCVLGSRVLHGDVWKAVQRIEQKVGIDQMVKDQQTQGRRHERQDMIASKERHASLKGDGEPIMVSANAG